MTAESKMQLKSIILAVEQLTKLERDNMLFMRAITNGSITDRDRIQNYTVGQYFYEKSLFIEENEIKAANIKKSQKQGEASTAKTSRPRSGR